MLFNTELPINPLSFGHISFGILNEFYQRNLFPNLFPIGNVDIGCYDKVGTDFGQYISNCVNKAPRNFKKNLPFLKLWHINGSWPKIGEPSHLLTFHELDNITDTEVNILNSYNKIFVTSSFSKRIFENCGVNVPVVFTPMGLDDLHFHRIDKKTYDDGRIVFGIFAKIEARKNTLLAIKGWCKKFANDKRYCLHICVNNPFMSNEESNAFYAQCFDNKRPPYNTVIYPFQPNDSLYNQLLNSCDIIIDISSGESLSLPSLTAVGLLKKHAIINHNTAFLDWADDENSVLIKPCGKRPAYDGKFFAPNALFNQGNIFDIAEDDYLNALDVVLARYNKNPINEAGSKLKDKYSFKNGIDIILKEMAV